MHKRPHKQAEDDRDNDDGHAPVIHDVVKELDTVEDPVFKHIPHLQNPFQRKPSVAVIFTAPEPRYGLHGSGTPLHACKPFREPGRSHKAHPACISISSSLSASSPV